MYHFAIAIAIAIAQNLERDTGGALIFRLYQLVLGYPFKLGAN